MLAINLSQAERQGEVGRAKQSPGGGLHRNCTLFLNSQLAVALPRTIAALGPTPPCLRRAGL